ncbi:MAG TPA: ATP-binding protein [Bacteroidales bacterium]|nr:ATP-binding protein [Bacteroidales bacterium]HPT10012.1 ATP-binding protein [Bacteroidales bacterium]
MNTKKESSQKRKNLINIVELIANQAANSTLSNQFMKNIKDPAEELSAFLGCTRIQAVLFSVVCSLNFSNKTVGLEQVANWLGSNPLSLARYLNDLENLQKKKILRSEPEISNISNISSIPTTSFSVNPEVFNALRKGEPIMKTRQRIQDSYGLIKAICAVIGQCNEELISVNEMWKEIATVEKECSSIKFCRDLKSQVNDKQERALFLNLCDEYFAGNFNCDLLEKIRQIEHEEQRQLEIRFRITTGVSQLVKKDLIETRESFFRSDIEIRLTDNAVGLITSDNPRISVCMQDKKNPDLILSGNIVKKDLLFAPREKEKLESLIRVLMPAEHGKLVRRLSASGMKTGIAILLDGPPGTGKTESVLQIARRTGRDIYQVTISETKSKWFGESERVIKSVFDRYRKLSKEATLTPILFFNEADGIFSSRKRIGESDMDQTENAIQNIILQELEDFSGILIATTNMMQNFDKAFERRFLYKIHLGKPTAEIRSLIWKNRIPLLSKEKTLELARKFDLTGGQIDNVVRKYSIERIHNGKPPTQRQIESLCLEESPNHEINRIGFKI